MKSIKFAWGLLVIVVGFLVLGIGNMVWTSMSDAPYTIETSAEGNQYLKGTVFEVGKEGAGKLSNNVSTSAIVDGKVEKLKAEAAASDATAPFCPFQTASISRSDKG